MAASSRGSRAAVPLLRTPPLCTRCATLSQRLAAPASRRSYSADTPASSNTSPSSASSHIVPPTIGSASPLGSDDAAAAALAAAAADGSNNSLARQPTTNLLHPKSLFRLRAGLILSRPPILTREQTPFESAFYLYQKRLNERLSTPFARQFYFREGLPGSIDFAIKFGERSHVMAREIGRVTRKGRDAWDDEALLEQGKELANPDAVREKLYTEAESRVSEDGEALSFEDRLRIERPLGRETEADRSGDVQRLDRKLDRTLYLIVKDAHGRWTFPQDEVRPDEGLHETAARALESTAGVNMNTWMVGRHPIAYEHRKPIYKSDDKKPEERVLKALGRNVFYLKGRIMAGQVDLSHNEYGVTDFKWLTKDELKEALQPGLFQSVEKSMPAQ
ncbi:39S mitochondrial ribosomal protein L46-domain-containing protein [Coniella lustricola]|uniref:Large ribosomal subunit protein mL46 n=1 Tax=Coniella lustricola TaxID=2025994 RepID=A0A2T3AF78_9PEZI|nr:39S mitochondrial ribosomal protein L46-domain-containing protein [Coniella lustricola]